MFSKLKWFYHSSAFKLATTLNLVFVALLVLTWIVTREVVDEALYNRAETELLVRMKNLQENHHLSQKKWGVQTGRFRWQLYHMGGMQGRRELHEYAPRNHGEAGNNQD